MSAHPQPPHSQKPKESLQIIQSTDMGGLICSKLFHYIEHYLHLIKQQQVPWACLFLPCLPLRSLALTLEGRSKFTSFWVKLGRILPACFSLHLRK